MADKLKEFLCDKECIKPEYEQIIKAQERVLDLAENLLKELEWKEGSDISDINNINPYWFCEICVWHRENGHDPRCESKVKIVLSVIRALREKS